MSFKDLNSSINKKCNTKIDKQFFIVIIACFVIMFALLVRLFLLQIVHHNEYQEKWDAHKYPVVETTEVPS